MECKGCVFRIRQCVYDLLAMEEDFHIGCGPRCGSGCGCGRGCDCVCGCGWEEEGMWELIARELRLKSTFLYCDLTQVISAAKEDNKEILTDISNKLFFYMEELEEAVKSRSISLSQACYPYIAHALRELLAALLPAH